MSDTLPDPTEDPQVELPRLGDLKAGDIFAVQGQELYPKIKLENGGYWDFHKSIANASPSMEWRCRQYTAEGSIEILNLAHGIKREDAEDRVYNWPQHYAEAQEEIESI